MPTTFTDTDVTDLANIFDPAHADLSISRRMGFAVHGQADPALPTAQVLKQDLTNQTMLEMASIPSDDRWAYMEAWGCTQDYLDRLSAMMRKWMSPESEDRLLEMAASQNYDSPVDLVVAWVEIAPQTLREIFTAFRLDPPEPAFCYAVIDAIETAAAALRLEHRRTRIGGQPPIWTNGLPEDRAEDIQWAEAGYDEEVASWPQH